MEVHEAGYKQRLLDKMLDYAKIVGRSYLQEDSKKGVSRTLINPMNQWQKLDFARLSDGDLATIETYKKGVCLLKSGCEKEGKKEIKKAADRGLPHARYVYSLTTFKEIVQCHMNGKSRFPPKNDIDEAIQYMIHVKKEFFPLPSFILGIMQSYSQIFVKEMCAAVTSVRKCFDDVLSGIDCREGNYSIIAPKKYIVMEDEGKEFFKWIVQSVKYELARGMLLCPEGLSGAMSLLQELSSDDFVDAECLYALELLKKVLGVDGKSFKKRNFIRAYELLERAINHGHKEAMFFFGTLPFRHDFKILGEDQSWKGRCCLSYLEKYSKTYGKVGEFEKDSEILLAAEYVKKNGSYVTYDEEMAMNILRKHDCLIELRELEKKLQERKDRAKNVLHDVLGALEQVHGELKKKHRAICSRIII